MRRIIVASVAVFLAVSCDDQLTEVDGPSFAVVDTWLEVDGESGCLNIGGAWAGSTCTVGTYVVPGNVELAIGTGVGLTVTTALTVNGNLVNHGTISNTGTVDVGSESSSNATFTNNGSFENATGAQLRVAANSTGSTIVNDGHIINAAGAGITIGAGCASCVVENNGDITSWGRFESEDGAVAEISSLGDIVLLGSGNIRIGTGSSNRLLNSGRITVGSDATLAIYGARGGNAGDITVEGTFVIGSGIEFPNAGQIAIACGATFINDGTISGAPVELEVCSTTVDGEAGCSALAGSWSGTACTLGPLTIPVGVTITIAEGVTVVEPDTLYNNGLILNAGTVEVGNETGAGGLFQNLGEVQNLAGAQLRIVSGGTDVRIVNESQIVNAAGADLVSRSGCAGCAIENRVGGTIDNAGRLESEDDVLGEILNAGTITNTAGTLRIGAGTDNRLTNADGGIIIADAASRIVIAAAGSNNTGTIATAGTFRIEDGVAEFLNEGEIANSSQFVVGAGVELANAGQLTNSGAFTLQAGAVLANAGTVHFVCGSTFENNGSVVGIPIVRDFCSSVVVDGESGCLALGEHWSNNTCTLGPGINLGPDVTLTIAAGVTVLVPDTLYNNGGILNSGTLQVGNPAGSGGLFWNLADVQNLPGARLENLSGSDLSRIVNEGRIENQAGAGTANGSGCTGCVIENRVGGTIDNAGRLESEDAVLGEILNAGTIANTGGTLRIGTGTDNRLTNAVGGIINADAASRIVIAADGSHNAGTITTAGTFRIEDGVAAFTNDGQITNSGAFSLGAGSVLTNNGLLYFICGSTFDNDGTVLGNAIVHTYCSSIVVDGETGCLAVGEDWTGNTCTISGVVSLGPDVTLTIAEGVTVVVTDTLASNGGLLNSGTLEVGSPTTSDALFINLGQTENLPGAYLENVAGAIRSSIINDAQFINHAGASLLNRSNCAGCVIENRGLDEIENSGRIESEDGAAGEIRNAGTITNTAGTLRIGTGTQNLLTNFAEGTINGDAASSIVIAADGSHNAGTITTAGTFLISDGVRRTLNDGVMTSAGPFTIGLGAELINNGTIHITCDGTFTNNGTLTGAGTLTEDCGNQAPIAEPGGGYAGLEGSAIMFDGSASYDPNGDPLNYAWDFGDGDAGSGPMPSHTYQDNGEYAVCLTVDDGELQSVQVCTSVPVSNVAPALTLIGGPAGPVPVGLPVQVQVEFFDPAGDADAPYVAECDWGDGSSSRVTVPSGATFTCDHVYMVPGSFSVAVSVQDDDGDSDHGIVTIVAEQVPAAIAVIPDALTFDALGQGPQLEVIVEDPTGAPIPDPTVQWSTGDSAVATVTNGWVTATGNGTTTITARAGDVEGSATVTVEQIPAAVIVEPGAVGFEALSATEQLTATVEDANQEPILGATVEWRSNNETIAEVNQDGRVTANGNGTTIIDAIAGNVHGTVRVTVEQVPALVVVEPGDLTFDALGQGAQLTAFVADRLGMPIEGLAVTWSTADSRIATVTDGWVTPNANGTTEIFATGGGVQGTATITVAQVAAAVTVEPGTVEFNALGATQQMTASVWDANNAQIPGAAVEWGTEDPAVATVAENGTVTARGNGTTAVTAAAGGVQGSATITVAQVAAAVTVEPGTVEFGALGATQQMTASVVDANDTPIPGATVTWSSANDAVATVTAGVVTAVGPGTTTIAASVGDVRDTATVTVQQIPTAVRVAPDALLFVAWGAREEVVATVLDANDFPIAGTVVTWSSANPEIASVTDGWVTAVSNGTTSITAAFGDVEDTVAVTVDQPNRAPVADPGSGYVGNEGAPFGFDGSASSDADDDPLEYEWTFGDGTTGSGVTPTHTYADNGVFEVCLTVNDGELSDTRCTSATVDNVAPVLGMSAAAVAVVEGDVAANSGTVSDPGADEVTLAASVGTVTDNADGTWSWSFGTSDGPDQSQTVTITATDDDGAANTATFTLTVENAVPTVAVDLAEVTVNEGERAENTGTRADVGDDGITLTASLGSVVDNGDGTWSWSFGTSDGPDQSQTVTITATDDDGAANTATFTLTVENAAPTVAVDLAEVTVNQGETAQNTGTWADVGNDAITLTASVGTVVDNGDGRWSWSFATTDGPAESQSVTITGTDDDGAAAAATFMLTVDNVAPTVGPITAPIDPVPVGTPIHAEAAFTDPGTGDTHTATWNWGDGMSSGTVDGSTVADDHTYDAAGVYELVLTVTDDDGGVGSATYQFVVVYDPAGGFVTGGGWFDSPDGAYAPDPSLTGKATFGFVSKYQRGASVPTGNTQFQFKAGDLTFHSDNYEWLVVNQGGARAQFRGTGTINGQVDRNGAEFKFMIWAGDGPADSFRIKIWWEEGSVEHAVYDNGFDQEIRGGSIAIHR